MFVCKNHSLNWPAILKGFFFLLAIGYFASVFADDDLACANEVIERKLLENPQYKAEFDAINQSIAAGYLHKTSTETLLTIPIAVHIIHLGEPIGTGSNISDEQVIAAVQGANERWRNITGEGVDMEIEFCLAQTDPDGNPSNGIDHIDGSSVLYYKDHGIAYIGALGDTGASETAIKNLSNWPHNYVYNIWVVDQIAGGWGGYAFFPLVNNYPTDGVVIVANSMRYSSSTLAHELGHGMGLFHTFNGDFTGCPGNSICTLLGDQVCDTPPHRQQDCQSTPCSNEPDSVLRYSFKNYMSYCSGRNLFTQGQKDRSRNAILTTSRKKLLSDKACTRWCDTAFTFINFKTCDPDSAGIHIDTLNSAKGCDSLIITTTDLEVPAATAAFSFSVGTNDSIHFENHSSNADEYFWDFGDGTNSNESDPTHLYLSGNTYPVMLVAQNACESDTAYADVILVSTGLGKNNKTPVLLYPNPSTGNFQLEMEVTNIITYIDVINEAGLTVAQQILSPGKYHSITLENKLPKGNYLIHIRQRGKTIGSASIIIF